LLCVFKFFLTFVTIWALSRPEKIDFYLLGFSELFQSVMFSSLLMIAFLWH
jgi:hypothetical protein